MAIARARGRPEAEGAVDMDPGARRMGEGAGALERIEGAGIEIARLQADDRRAIAGALQRRCQRRELDRTEIVAGKDLDRGSADAEQPDGADYRLVAVLAGQDA